MEEGYTFTKKHTIVYEWEINKITSLMEYKENKNSVILKSSEFSTRAKIKNKWCLQLYLFNGSSSRKFKDFMGIFLSNLEDHSVNVFVSFSILNSKQEKCLALNLKITLNAGDTKGHNKIFAKQTLLTNDSVMIPNDILTICVEVTVNDEETKIPVEKSLVFSKSQMSNDFREFYNSRAFSDMTIVIGDQILQAHKIIIIARSPVLAAMFTLDMNERKTDQVFITDITAETFEKLLEYVYTDEVSDLDVVAEDLLEAADKYQIMVLKKMCEVSLCKTLKSENAIRRMDLADRHNAKDLMEYVTKCITADALNVIETEDFKKYEKSTTANPSLGFKLFRAVAAANIYNGAGIKYSTN